MTLAPTLHRTGASDGRNRETEQSQGTADAALPVSVAPCPSRRRPRRPRRTDHLQPRLLAVVAALDVATVAEVAEAADLPEKAARAGLLDLARAGLVERLVLPQGVLVASMEAVAADA